MQEILNIEDSFNVIFFDIEKYDIETAKSLALEANDFREKKLPELSKIAISSGKFILMLNKVVVIK